MCNCRRCHFVELPSMSWHSSFSFGRFTKYSVPEWDGSIIATLSVLLMCGSMDGQLVWFTDVFQSVKGDGSDVWSDLDDESTNV